MTRIGKLLVVFNVVLSLLLAGWAFGVYTGRIDWSDAKPKGSDPGGVLTERKAEVDAAKALLYPAEKGWVAAEVELREKELAYAEEGKWYDQQLQQLVDSPGPVATVELTKGGAPAADLKDPNRPKLVEAKDRAGKPLQSELTYALRSRQAFDSLVKLQKEIRDQVEEDSKNADRLAGTDEMRGLRQRLADERLKAEDVQTEVERTRPLLVNTAVALGLVRESKQSINTRLQELRAYLKKAHGVDVASGER